MILLALSMWDKRVVYPNLSRRAWPPLSRLGAVVTEMEVKIHLISLDRKRFYIISACPCGIKVLLIAMLIIFFSSKDANRQPIKTSLAAC